MTALVKGVARDAKESKLIALPVKADVIIFRGALVKVGADGFAAPCAAEAGAVFAGVSRTEVDATGLNDGECLIQVEIRDSYYVNMAGALAADVFKKVYAADDNTVQLAAGTNLQEAGKIIEVVSATKVLVMPNPNLTK